MPLHYIIGRSGSGKTTHMLERIKHHLREQPDGPPIILLVPEQGTFQVEHELVSTPEMKGMLRAQVLSFRRLAYRVMQETGGTALTPINEEGKKMLLYKILQRRKADLPLFSGAAEQFGFIEKLNDLFDEMKRYRIQASDLDEHLSFVQSNMSGHSLLSAKLRDMSGVLHEFEAELAEHYLDGEDVLARLAEGMPQSDYVRNATIYIDGFHGFTPQEYAVLASLMLHARDMTICLCVDRPYEVGEVPHELNLFHPTATTFIKLREISETLGFEIGSVSHLKQGDLAERLADDERREQVPTQLPRFKQASQLAHLERHFERKVPWRNRDHESKSGSQHRPNDDQSAPDQASITVRAAVHRRAEVEAAAREMLRRAREDGVRWREMAIMVRNIADYGDIISTVFQDAGIPYFMDQKRTVLDHPFVEMTRAALDMISGYWKYDAVFRFVKTEFLLTEDEHITRADFDRLENYVLACGIEGSRWTNGRPWPAEFNQALDPDDPEHEERKNRTAPEWIEHCRQLIVTPVAALERALGSNRDVRGKCEALYRFWIALNVPHKLERMSQEALLHGDVQRAREHRQMWGAMLDILDQMVEMVGEERMSVELFAGMLETGLESIKMAIVPPALDQVLIASMDRTRSGQIKHLYLLGINDGVIPSRPTEDGVLTENERDMLHQIGMELAPGIRRKLLDERFIIYNALTAPSHTLWLSYALADEEGKSLLPSEVVRHVRGLFPHVQEQIVMAEPNEFMSEVEQAAYAGHPEAALRYLIVQLREWRRGRPIAPIWWDVYRWFMMQPDYRERLRTLTGSLVYRNQVEAIESKTSVKLYGKQLRTSVSRMERFVACPFAHFASHGLKLKERRTYKLEAPDIGQLFHAALSRMATDLSTGGRTWAALTQEECRAEADRIVDLLAPRLQGEILLSTKRYEHISRKLKQIVGRAASVIGEHSRRGKFEPVALEIDFGPDKQLPALQFTLPNGCTMEIIGRIDRVDRADSEQGVLLRVIDYKSSATDLKLHEVFYGLSLQMLTYLDVLITNAEEWLGTEAMPAGTLYFHVHNPLLQAVNGMSPEQAYDQLLKKFKMRGLVLADRDVVSLMDEPLDKGYSDILPVAVKADGSFYSNASVATNEQWGVLRSTVRNVIQRIGTRITDGDVQIDPYRLGPKKACDHCQYKPVCQFDELVEGNQFNMLPRMSKDEAWTKLEGGS
ncbi:helicase-exonuclease AddAB subunit AddB [Paenibacillus sp. 481]|uniref:helicase-exonuclease AddAB subunit AddB n=1 Tax=Paenibacillus sp. 481 TaxID=2835869 RepID=UPI001E42056A|nr:helicase-exonuclease AddAB subunit AddB [Paenibacillus sp. 481]UHA74180.1 helicase-exonuclease AddAB subunit AddB [Paenibacillus sp. 481]